MMRRAFVAVFTFALGIGIGVSGTILYAQSQPVKHTPLISQDLSGLDGKEGFAVKVEYAPGAIDKKHYHPAHLFTYVLEGAAMWEVEGQPPITLKAGDIFYDPPRRPHIHGNASQTEPAKLLVFMVAEKGQPRAIPVPR